MMFRVDSIVYILRLAMAGKKGQKKPVSEVLSDNQQPSVRFR